jgi:hypothetical protein
LLAKDAENLQSLGKSFSFPIASHEAENTGWARRIFGDGLQISVRRGNDLGDFLREVWILAKSDVLHALSAGDKCLEILAVELLLFDGEIFPGTEVQAFPGLEPKSISGAGAVLGRDVLFDGILVRMDDIETSAVGRIAEKVGRL